MSVKGIDISKWNGNINFKSLSQDESVKFVIIRDGYRKSIDPKFLEYVKGAKAYNIPVLGVYHFIYFDGATIKENAKSCVDNIKKAGLDPKTIWVFADLEYDTWEKAGVKASKAKCTAYTKEFCEEVKRLGCANVGVYCNNDYYKNLYDWNSLKDYKDKVWLSDYSGSPDYSCIIQQTGYTKVKGISGDVDGNILIKEDLLKQKATTTTMKKEVSTVKYIAESGHDEHGRYTGGKAGDQTGQECYVHEYYNYPWNVFIEPIDDYLARDIANNGIDAANNDHIGYDQWQRNSAYAEWKKVGSIAKITKDCEVDCSALVSLCITQAGCDILTGRSNAPVTSTLRSILLNTGKFRRVSAPTKRGTICLSEGNHVAIYLGTSKEKKGGSTSTTTSKPTASTTNKTDTTKAELKPTSKKTFIVSGKTSPNRTKAYKGRVTASALNARTWAGVANATVSFSPLSKGAVVEVCDAIQASNGDTWLYVKFGTKYGFVNASYIKRV